MGNYYCQNNVQTSITRIKQAVNDMKTTFDIYSALGHVNTDRGVAIDIKSPFIQLIKYIPMSIIRDKDIDDFKKDMEEIVRVTIGLLSAIEDREYRTSKYLNALMNHNGFVMYYGECKKCEFPLTQTRGAGRFCLSCGYNEREEAENAKFDDIETI